MNKVILIGRLTADPELRMTKSNTAILKLTLAVDKGLSKDKKSEYEAEGKPTADFIPVTIMGSTAEAVARYVRKGERLAVEGRISISQYEDKSGQNKMWFEVMATSVEFINSAPKQEQPYEETAYRDFKPIDDENIPF